MVGTSILAGRLIVELAANALENSYTLSLAEDDLLWELFVKLLLTCLASVSAHEHF